MSSQVDAAGLLGMLRDRLPGTDGARLAPHADAAAADLLAGRGGQP